MRTLVPLLFVLAAACGTTDADEDGYPENVDCSDHDPRVNPGAVDVCNGIDDDCSGAIDDVLDPPVWYADADGDRWGDEDQQTRACFAAAGTVDVAGDCDDTNPLIHEGAAETDCSDPTDYNCDGSTGYADADGDGFAACDDCDDLDAAVKPGASEICNDLDDDCDGKIDDADDSIDVATQTTTYADADDDGYGNAAAVTIACDAPAGNVTDATDCDDTNDQISPRETESCNGGVDDDCDGTADGDDATGKSTFYADTDADGYGDEGSALSACVAPTGYVTQAYDCDDANAAAWPGAPETCDAADNDCDGEIDNDPIDPSPFYVDADADGYGDPTKKSESCAAPTGYVSDATDCDDTKRSVSPGASETCDGTDEDCDGVLDDGLPQKTWYLDADGDGAGDPDTGRQACAAPPGHTGKASDCDDGDALVHPGVDELCDDDLDNNCDGKSDCDDIDNCKAVDEVCWACGDGTLDPDEQCDDSNTTNGDGCSDRCEKEFSTGCAFQQAEHPAYTNTARDVVLCGGTYTSSNIKTACAPGWHVCLHKEWNARFPKGSPPGGALTSWGASQSARCPGGVWEAMRPTGPQIWGSNVCNSAYNPWNNGKFLFGDDGTTILQGNGNCCSWDSAFSPTGGTSGYAVYCCR